MLSIKALGRLSYPVTESNHLRTPTENSSDTDTPGKLPYPIPEENKKKTELGETEATCTSRTETTATTERCTPPSGIGKKLNHRKASEASRATSDLQKLHTCKD